MNTLSSRQLRQMKEAEEKKKKKAELEPDTVEVVGKTKAKVKKTKKK